MATTAVYPSTKICTKCGKEWPVSEFWSHGHTRDGLHPHCKECSRKRYKAWATSERGKKRIAERQSTKGGRKVTAICKDLRSIRPCCVCGESDPACIDFHHIEPRTKKMGLAECRSVEMLITEAKKCAPVCRNCHAKYHAGSITPIFSPITDDEIDEVLRRTGARLLREGGIFN